MLEGPWLLHEVSGVRAASPDLAWQDASIERYNSRAAGRPRYAPLAPRGRGVNGGAVIERLVMLPSPSGRGGPPLPRGLESAHTTQPRTVTRPAYLARTQARDEPRLPVHPAPARVPYPVGVAF